MSIHTITRTVKIGSREATIIVVAEGPDSHTILSRIVSCVGALEGVNSPRAYLLTLRNTRVVLKERTRRMSRVLKLLLGSNEAFPTPTTEAKTPWFTTAEVFRLAKDALEGFRELKQLPIDKIIPESIVAAPVPIEHNPTHILSKETKYSMALDALSKCNNNRRDAAKFLAIGERTLYRWLSFRM